MEISTHSPEETKELAVKIATKIKKGDVIALYGDLGAGKTTFTRYLAEALGSVSRVQSPTFVVARRYGGSIPIQHLDLYRLTSEDELEDIGISELLADEEGVVIIEWPQVAEKFLPESTIRIYFEYVEENERKIKVQNLH